MTTILVQEIDVIWGKSSRGGKAAAERNALPEAVELPAIQPYELSCAFVHDSVWMRESLNHRVTISEYSSLRTHLGCIWIELQEDVLSVTYSYNRLHGGAPERSAYPRKVLTLTLGTWGCIIYNGRFSSREGGLWYYRKTVFNIGYFENFTSKVFLTTPERTFSDMADLF